MNACINNSEETENTVSFGDTSEDFLSSLEDTTSDSSSTLWDDSVEAEMEDVLWFLEDTNCKETPGP